MERGIRPLCDGHRLRMVVPQHVELGCVRVGLDLLDVLAAGDDAGDAWAYLFLVCW